MITGRHESGMSQYSIRLAAYCTPPHNVWVTEEVMSESIIIYSTYYSMFVQLQYNNSGIAIC